MLRAFTHALPVDKVTAIAKWPVAVSQGWPPSAQQYQSCCAQPPFDFPLPMGRHRLILAGSRGCEREDAYYAALSAADQVAEATPFVEFMLQVLRQALGEALETQAFGSGQGSVERSEQTPLLMLLAANPALTARRAAERLGLSPRAVEKQLAALKASGRLRRVGPNKGGYWQE